MTNEAPIRLSAKGSEGEATIEGRVALSIGGKPLVIDIEAPQGPTTLEAVLPVFQGLTDLLVQRAEARLAAEGRAVSCLKGCAACCRQAVQVSEPEARALAAVVEAMPEPRRSAVRARFTEARRRLRAEGMVDRLAALPKQDDAALVRFVLDYFRLGIDCPFLEDACCSIHPVRPLNCREYLVTTPAAACSDLSPESVRTVQLEGSVCGSVLRLGQDATPQGWMLLIDALSFVDDHPGPAPLHPGPAWIEAGFARLAGKSEQGG